MGDIGLQTQKGGMEALAATLRPQIVTVARQLAAVLSGVTRRVTYRMTQLEATSLSLKAITPHIQSPKLQARSALIFTAVLAGARWQCEARPYPD